MKIDFKNEDWKSKLKSIDGQKISAVIFENYNNELDTEKYNIEVQNITFENGLIANIPFFLNDAKINYMHFSNCQFVNSNIGLGKLKALLRINFSGNSIKILPEDLDKINDLTHLFISSTSVETIDVDFSKLTFLQVFNLNSNERLYAIRGDFGQCAHLKEIEIFQCDKLKELDISENKSIKRIRIGSWNPEFNLQNTFDKLKNLEIVIIDNYKSSNFIIDFLKGKPVKELKIYCPSSKHIPVIKELQFLEILGLWREPNCSDQSFLYKELTAISSLKQLTLNIGKLDSSKEFIDYISLFKGIDYVKLIDTKWDQTQWNNALSGVPASIKLEINN